MGGLDVEQRRARQPDEWLHRAVIYRVETRSFRDSNGDGVGDLNGIRERLDHLRWLGVDRIWLNGFLASPVGEPGHGREVDPILGGPEDFAALVAECHEVGIGVSIDLSVDRARLARPRVEQEVAATTRHWLERGVDGLRIGITPGLTDPAGPELARIIEVIAPVVAEFPRRAVSGYVDDRIRDLAGLQHLTNATDLRLCTMRFDAADVRKTVGQLMATFAPLDTAPIAFLAGWAMARPVSRFGGGHDGLARARAMAMVQLAIPGLAGIDNGDELGLAEYLQADEYGSQFTRGFMPWDDSNETFGFTDAPHTTPPAPARWVNRTVQAQRRNPSSMLCFYQRMLRIRREYGSTHGTPLHWFGAPEGCLAFRCGTHGLVCALNTTDRPVALPPGRLLLASDPDTTEALPADSAAWLIQASPERGTADRAECAPPGVSQTVGADGSWSGR